MSLAEFWSVRRAANTLGLSSPNDTPLTRVWTDTRTIERGDLFVALKGEKFDAHDFLADAVSRGAAAVVVHDGSRASGLGVPVLVVDDTLVAFGALARFYRTAWSRPVVAVGGSNGKTTTKEFIRAVLGSVFEVHATPANLNNRIGAPQTLLSIDENKDMAVVEVGTNEPGEIAALRDIVHADIAAITTVQAEHLEGFGDLDGVIAEELSLCDDVALAIVPAAEARVVDEARKRARAVTTAGLESGDVTPDAWGLGNDGCGWLRFGDTTVHVPIPGGHNAANAVIAVAVARAFGVSDADAARGLAGVTIPPMRSAVREIGEVLLVNDAYNANPASMIAALDLLRAVAGARPQVAVLGTMREMGAAADSLHDDVARAALASRATLIGAVGEFVAAFKRVAPNDPRIVGTEDPEQLWPLLEPRLAPNAAILLKASRGVRLERLVPFVEKWASEGSEGRRAKGP
ncbi:MAG TPA: UDP-N-acetylmuramoyl-tripeptide--D-alanyl-D-alanine ligase [Gemmatimonadaceae bacterium]|nr:UDP-N-acetylmuramoyl-tripeptide--D-alanyl-D-alanine ligase [Gemmatimonadaceae bacterium]